MNRFRHIVVACLAPLVFAAACSDDRSEERGTSFAGDRTTLYVSSEAGRREFDLVTTGKWSVVPVNSDTRRWVAIEGDSEGEGNATLTVSYRANTSFSREGRLAVRLADARVADTIVLRQYGATPVLEFRQSEAEVVAMGSETFELGLATNFSNTMKERIRIRCVAVSGTEGEWIEQPVVSEDFKTLCCTIGPNRDQDRVADLVMSYTDDWGIEYTASCRVSQLSLGGTPDTELLTFAEARALATGPETEIARDCAISGIVVSDCTSDNVAENPNLTPTTIDYTANYRTVYLQSSDGSYGFAVRYASSAENTFKRYDKVTLWLKGTRITKQTGPERYTISRLSSKAVVNLVAGTPADVPAKEKYIDELTADDLYTQVTLRECEFPVRKGSYTPINEGYGSAYNAFRVDKYPFAVRDRRGGHLFLYTNLSASWRRDGSVVPQGAGKITGVIVHEPYERFEKEGYIGDFQIRPLFREDIAVAQEASEGFSKILAAWNVRVLENNRLSATSGKGELMQTSAAYAATAYAANDFSFPGPIDGATDNKGVTPGQGWANAYWWDGANDCGEAWLLKFSTAGITADHLALTFSAMHNAIGAPRYWSVEWSTHGEKLGKWEHIADYTVPDPVNWSNTLPTQLAGSKNVSLELPVEMLGKSTVYLRLKAARNQAGTATAYDGAAIGSGKASALSYVAIHYNN